MTLIETANGNGSHTDSDLYSAVRELPPRLATANDIRELVQYLKRRPAGVNIHDVPQPIKKRIFFPAKIASYEFWGLVNVERDRIRLTPLGYDFARSLDPEARAYRELLDNTPFYRGALEWIQREHIDLVTQGEIADYWRKEFAWMFINSDEKNLGSAVVTFFQLCQAAEVGAMTIGKRGQPARLRVWC
jgi:hypothetical protein